jgi:transcriptional regulator with XRE-family HTH domain
MNAEALFAALDVKRRQEGLSWRDVARATGVSPSVFTRIAQGRRPDVDTFLTLCTWVGVSPGNFRDGETSGSDTLAVISAHLRADRALAPGSAEAIERIVQAAYTELSTHRTGRPD